MKKAFKILFYFIIVIVSIFLINFFRNYYILSSIFNSNELFKESIDNYYYEENFISENSHKKISIYAQKNIYYVEIFLNNKHNSNIWIDNINKEYIVQNMEDETITLKEYDDYYINRYKFMCLAFHDFGVTDIIKKNYLFKPIIKQNDEYVINVYEENIEAFVDKNSKLITKVKEKDYEIYYKFDTTIEKEISKPNI